MHNNKDCRGCYGEIATIVAESRALFAQQTRGVMNRRELLISIWRAMGVVLEDVLCRKKSCIILGFLHVSIKVHSILFFDGPRTFYKPQLVLEPDFTSAFHLQNVLTMRDAHYHASVPSNISYVAIAALAGTNRFVVEAAMKDSIREIGKYLQRNPSSVLTIDMGVCDLEFTGREYRIKWNANFMQRLREQVGPQALVSPYDPPSMTSGGPHGACRLEKGCITQQSLREDFAATRQAESRLSVAEMNDGFGNSAYRSSSW